MSGLTQERLKEILEYDEKTGLFRWIQPPENHPRLKGYVAGGCATGYVLIKIDGKKRKAHRLAWLYVNGEWPPGDIDHINGCPMDNRMTNLRVATNPQNQANKRTVRGRELPKGVRKLPSGKYQARVSVNGEIKSLGSFKSIDEASAAYLCAARSYYGEFARAG